MLYYLPIFMLLTANLWHGVTVNYSVTETVLYLLTMLCVGFLEEVIFRGLLFEAMREDNVKAAVIVSSVTFGIGHIINLINGSGAELLPNLLQVIYATAAGFMFVMMYCKSKSLTVCIVTHGIFNALSAFVNEANVTNETQISDAILLTLIAGSYAIYLTFSMKRKKNG
jgi:membrane protease YdiL (CAAX protease family)